MSALPQSTGSTGFASTSEAQPRALGARTDGVAMAPRSPFTPSARAFPTRHSTSVCTRPGDRADHLDLEVGLDIDTRTLEGIASYWLMQRTHGCRT